MFITVGEFCEEQGGGREGWWLHFSLVSVMTEVSTAKLQLSLN